MNAFSSMRRTSQALRWSGAMNVRLLGLGWAASVPVVGAATIGVLVSPHVRGLQFFPALRYAITTPAHEDRGFPGSDLARFEKVFPQHQTIDLPAAGHFFFEDAADQMIPAIRAFSERMSAPALRSDG